MQWRQVYKSKNWIIESKLDLDISLLPSCCRMNDFLGAGETAAMLWLHPAPSLHQCTRSPLQCLDLIITLAGTCVGAAAVCRPPLSPPTSLVWRMLGLIHNPHSYLWSYTRHTLLLHSQYEYWSTMWIGQATDTLAVYLLCLMWD